MSNWWLDQDQYGSRLDATNKGQGYYGPLLGNNGQTSTELSFGFNHNGKEYLAPLLVPGLDIEEIYHLLSGRKPTATIYQKAQQFAIQRQLMGKPMFARPFDLIRLPQK